jgi:hypothetical protein
MQVGNHQSLRINLKGNTTLDDAQIISVVSIDGILSIICRYILPSNSRKFNWTQRNKIQLVEQYYVVMTACLMQLDLQ